MASEEVLSPAEVLPPSGAGRTLTPPQLQAAVAEASGANRTETAAIVGVSTSAIKQWRLLPEYQAEVERLKQHQAEILSEPVRRLREELVDGSRAAVKALVLQLDATDDRDRPANTTRREAARLLLEHATALIKEDVTARAKAAAAESTGPTTSITVNLGDKPPTPDV